ncbi:tRNA (N(6)-L-threonylcarbamoyladenosine(37)-C(2))-methylthiotransferase MtaB [Liberiplasma polymorphum]|uniref:tRNA (N(6)-L-threonylcarbamoyladenosine(37)-C(2))- methylthiotransferase MtaB n=1 Tax=Liberiplasma polymorphum TaxID=3374570 RepID=UPI0037748E03
MKVAFYTLGCKVNTYESEALQNLFEADGFSIVNYKEYSDVYVINTCTVTNQSDSKSRKSIRQAIKRNPDAIVAVIGCYSQVANEEVSRIEGVDIIMGTARRERLLELVKQYMRERSQINSVQDISKYKTFDELNVTSFSENTRAFIKIQDGCNQYCSYCIIPFARGPIRSRDKDEIIREARSLIASGYQEIVLTGIHTGGYGSDLKDISFYDLLKALSELEGLKRLRISSIEINQLTEEILDLLENYPVFASHLHIPIQSGSDEILSKMRRRYDLNTYLSKITEIKRRMPNIAITTDVIVGYPEETDAHFEEIKNTLKTIGFSELHVFPYSKRSGTKAAIVKDHVHGTIKSMRVNALILLNEQLANQYIDKVKTDAQNVLFERCDGQYCYGHTSNYLFVKVATKENLINTMHNVIIKTASYPESIAEFIKQ